MDSIDHRQVFCFLQFSSVQLLSRVRLSATLYNPMNRSTPGLPVYHQLLEFTQTHVHRVGDAIQPSHPLLSPSPPAPNPSQHQSLFQWVSFSFSISPSNENPGLISFRMDWLDRLAVQGTLKSLLQHHSSKTSVLRLFSYHPIYKDGELIFSRFCNSPELKDIIQWILSNNTGKCDSICRDLEDSKGIKYV